jgi:uncharacterized surface protein with fasciclin (FAS1) repeats
VSASLAFTSNVQALSFPDVPSSNPFFNEITSLTDNGVVSGFADGTFKPNNMVTRGEFVKFVQNGVLVNKEDTSCTPFPDVPSTSTFFKHVTTIKCLGIASGFPDGQFKPNQNITRGEATKIAILSAKKRANDNTTLVAKSTSAPFSDVPVGSSFIQFVIPAKENNIVSGVTNNEFRPNEMLTRGEISKIVFNVRKLLKIENEKVVSKDIVDTALGISDFSSLTTALTKADLVNTLKGTGPFTVFAPTNSAFAKLPSATLNALLNDPAKLVDLQDILKYHVVAGKVKSTDIIGNNTTSLAVNSAKAVNGDELRFSLRNNSLFVNNSKVTTADVETTNGVIHIIDTVLSPVGGDVADAAIANSNLSSLVSALTAADLVNTLKGTGPFTVFAPTNSAFAKLPSATLNDLLTNPAKKTDLTNILLDHVVSGEVALNKNGNTSATTLGTDTVTISTSGETIKVNQENVLDVIKVSNGTIYVIDGVLLLD